MTRNVFLFAVFFLFGFLLTPAVSYIMGVKDGHFNLFPQQQIEGGSQTTPPPVITHPDIPPSIPPSSPPPSVVTRPTTYEQAISIAKQNNKQLFLLFLGRPKSDSRH